MPDIDALRTPDIGDAITHTFGQDLRQTEPTSLELLSR
jgi:hypothetical protein